MMVGWRFSSGESVTTELRVAGDFVHLLLQRDAFDQVLEVNHAADFGQDRERVRIPLEQDPGCS